uniref:Uncharacterized protein n=1 Tax=Setaria viridis TaxID=4556 RepID=A0A4U6T5R0_SETVI|nr:hypothetical protein SEVIR_9G405750v2 [Setaria viridis]
MIYLYWSRASPNPPPPPSLEWPSGSLLQSKECRPGTEDHWYIFGSSPPSKSRRTALDQRIRFIFGYGPHSLLTIAIGVLGYLVGSILLPKIKIPASMSFQD